MIETVQQLIEALQQHCPTKKVCIRVVGDASDSNIEALVRGSDMHPGDRAAADYLYLMTADDGIKSCPLVVPTATCVFCGGKVPLSTAHKHPSGWVGDECCWDERLRCTQ